VAVAGLRNLLQIRRTVSAETALSVPILITLNLGIFGKTHDHFRAELTQILKRFVSFAEFSFDLRGFQLYSLW
jgi:hypothetical protein